jgi:methionine-rich copper-binding protein CopC
VKRAALGSFLLLAGVALLVPLAAPASAHTELTRSTPADGESLAVAPAEVLLTFSEELIPETVKVSITDAQGGLVSAGDARVDAADVSLAWPDGLASGRYSVNYRVVSQDGHPVSGAISFSYPQSGPAASASATPATDSSTGASATAPASSAPATASPAAGQPAVPPTVLIAAGLAAGIGIGVAVAFRRRGRAI